MAKRSPITRGRKKDVMPKYHAQGPFQVNVGKFGNPKTPEALNRALSEMYPNRKIPHKPRGLRGKPRNLRPEDKK